MPSRSPLPIGHYPARVKSCSTYVVIMLVAAEPVVSGWKVLWSVTYHPCILASSKQGRWYLPLGKSLVV